MTTSNEAHAGLSGLAALSGEELAVRAAAGGARARAAFAELVTRYEGRLFNFLLRRVATRQDAEDLTQDAFVKAWEKIDSYDPTWRFSTWLFTIGSRLAITAHRRARPPMAASAARPDVAAAAVPDTEVERARGAHLWALAAERLTDEQHTALWLRYAEDMGIQEIGKVMSKSDVGVRVCLFRARQALAALCPGGMSGGGKSEETKSAAQGGAGCVAFAGGAR